MLPLDGERRPEPFLATQFNEFGDQFSPDGEWVAYQSNRSGRVEVYLRAYRDDAASVQVSTDGGTDARWSPSGRELFYRLQNSILAVSIDTARGVPVGDPTVLWENDRWEAPYGYDVSADGETFVVSLTTGEPEPARPVVIKNWFEELKRLVPTN